LREQEIANARRARAVEILLTIPWSRLQSEYRLRGAKPGNAGFRPDDVVYTPESEWQAIRGER
jgi:hypothetical protein